MWRKLHETQTFNCSKSRSPSHGSELSIEPLKESVGSSLVAYIPFVLRFRITWMWFSYWSPLRRPVHQQWLYQRLRWRITMTTFEELASRSLSSLWIVFRFSLNFELVALTTAWELTRNPCSLSFCWDVSWLFTVGCCCVALRKTNILRFLSVS